jgi:hypothetical protein
MSIPTLVLRSIPLGAKALKIFKRMLETSAAKNENVTLAEAIKLARNLKASEKPIAVPKKVKVKVESDSIGGSIAKLTTKQKADAGRGLSDREAEQVTIKQPVTIVKSPTKMTPTEVARAKKLLVAKAKQARIDRVNALLRIPAKKIGPKPAPLKPLTPGEIAEQKAGGYMGKKYNRVYEEDAMLSEDEARAAAMAKKKINEQTTTNSINQKVLQREIANAKRDSNIQDPRREPGSRVEADRRLDVGLTSIKKAEDRNKAVAMAKAATKRKLKKTQTKGD